MNEFEMIARYLAPLTNAEGLGLRDDAACVEVPSGRQLVVTKDALVEGVHFFATDAPGDIARKLLRVNLSDLAAKAAVPYGYLMAWMLPESLLKSSDLPKWVAAFTAGLAADQAAYGMTLLGGDTTRTPGPLCLSLTALGWVDAGRMLTRSGAQPGEDVYVTGTLGDAALGLQSRWGELPDIQPEQREFLEQRYLLPQPRVGLGPQLIGIASAAMDISDGLAQDAGHLAKASGLQIVIEAARLPFSEAANGPEISVAQRMQAALQGGDDYEILFTAPATQVAAIVALARRMTAPITRIGRVTKGQGVVCIDAQGKAVEIAQAGWQHF